MSFIGQQYYKLIFYYNDYLDFDISNNKTIETFYGDLWVGKKVELFNVKEDISEKHNLASIMPEKTQELVMDLKNWIKERDGLLPIPNPGFDSINWRKTGLLPSYEQPDIEEIFSLADTSSVKFTYKPSAGIVHTPFFIETFGLEAPVLPEYKGGVHGVRLANYAYFDNDNIEYEATNPIKLSIVTPEFPSDLGDASGGSALFFGAASATEKCYIKGISTIGYDSIQLSYKVFKGTGAMSKLSVRYSVDKGAKWESLTDPGNVSTGDNWKFILNEDLLPVTENLWLELGISTQFTLFDDIMLSGIKDTVMSNPENRTIQHLMINSPIRNGFVILPETVKIHQLTLTGLNGQLVAVGNDRNKIDVSNLSSGLYVLNLMDKHNNQVVQKLMIIN